MNNTQLYIPKKCKVGFNMREDTYTGRLGYIIYHDGKVWRKEKSWESWRQKEGQAIFEYNSKKREHVQTGTLTGVEAIEFENVPTEGFVLNKKAGGTNSGWNHRQTYCRVYDPRGWEFEITIPNLLFILQECSAYKGKGLEGELVYSWDGKDLVLLPVTSLDYKQCEDFTKLQSMKIGKKDLIPGVTYITARQDKLVYLGHIPVFEGGYYNNLTQLEIDEENASRKERYLNNKRYYGDRYAEEYVPLKPGEPSKSHVFYKLADVETVDVNDDDEDDYPLNEWDPFVFLNSLGSIKTKLSDDINPKFPDFIDELQKSIYFSHASHFIVDDLSPVDLYRLRNYGSTTVHKRMDIIKKDDINGSRRNCMLVNNDDDRLFNVYADGRGRGYNHGNDVPEESNLTLNEVNQKYGTLYRVYKNGYKSQKS